MFSREILTDFDAYLQDQGLTFEGVIIGGAALILLGLVKRATQDMDCLDPTIPEDIKQASVAFAKTAKLKAGWFNNGPESLKRDLPTGWEGKIQLLFQGRSIRLYTLGRLDLLRSKVYAFCDRQQDRDDCLALRPTLHELREIYPWVLERDANPLWPEHVTTSFGLLSKELGYEFNP